MSNVDKEMEKNSFSFGAVLEKTLISITKRLWYLTLNIILIICDHLGRRKYLLKTFGACINALNTMYFCLYPYSFIRILMKSHFNPWIPNYASLQKRIFSQNVVKIGWGIENYSLCILCMKNPLFHLSLICFKIRKENQMKICWYV